MIIGVAEITHNGVHHIMIETQAPDLENERKGTIETLCGTDAPQYFDLFNDEWGFLSLEDADDHLKQCHPICKRSQRVLKMLPYEENNGALPKGVVVIAPVKIFT